MALLATNLASQNPLTNGKPMYTLPRGAISCQLCARHGITNDSLSSANSWIGSESIQALCATCKQQSLAADLNPTTPIRHVVVIYDENISFDHYFGTYPHAVNGPGEVPFHAAPGTPTVNGLSGAFLSRNPNGTNPFRLDRADAITCDMDHAYSAEQKAYHDGLVNRVVQATTEYAEGQRNCDPKLIMGHYDGNTVAALWTYAEHFALNDNSFGTMFGPSTPGALNLVAAQTAGADQHDLPNETIGGNVISDDDPQFDDCAKDYLPAPRRKSSVLF